MSDGLTIQIDLVGDLDDLANRIMERAVLATQAGAERLVQEHRDLISDWSPESTPKFKISDASRDGNAVLRKISVDGWRWRLSNEGTKPVDIPGKWMAFPWEDPDRSYNSSYEPKISADFTSGSGMKHGKDFATRQVSQRFIHARHFDQKAIELARDDVIAVMRSFF